MTSKFWIWTNIVQDKSWFRNKFFYQKNFKTNFKFLTKSKKRKEYIEVNSTFMGSRLTNSGTSWLLNFFKRYVFAKLGFFCFVYLENRWLFFIKIQQQPTQGSSSIFYFLVADAATICFVLPCFHWDHVPWEIKKGAVLII